MPIDSVNIELRSYIDERMGAMEQRFLERLAYDKEALQHQAIEYARRLDELNHAHAKAVEVQGTYVRKETYEASLKELSLKQDVANREVSVRIDEVIKRISLVEKDNTATQIVTEERRKTSDSNTLQYNRRVTITMWAIGIAITIVNIAIGVLLRFIK